MTVARVFSHAPNVRGKASARFGGDVLSSVVVKIPYDFSDGVLILNRSSYQPYYFNIAYVKSQRIYRILIEIFFVL